MQPTILTFVAVAMSLYCSLLIGFNITKSVDVHKPTDTPTEYLVTYYLISAPMTYVMAKDLGYDPLSILLMLAIATVLSLMVGVMRGMSSSATL